MISGIKKSYVIGKIKEKLNNDRFTITEDVFGYDGIDAKVLSGGEKIRFLADITATLANSSGKGSYFLIEGTELDEPTVNKLIQEVVGRYEFLIVTSFYDVKGATCIRL